MPSDPTNRLAYQIGDTDNGQIVQMNALPPQVSPISVQDLMWRFAAAGKLFNVSDASGGADTVLGQTSYAVTTPTWLLRVPAGRTVIPLSINLSQSGSVAGAVINVIIFQHQSDRYVSGGTAELVSPLQKGAGTTVTCYSNPTADSSAIGSRLWSSTIGPDVSTAEGAVPGPFVTLGAPTLLEGPASLGIYTYAGTTAPTWLWNILFAEFPTAERAKWLYA